MLPYRSARAAGEGSRDDVVGHAEALIGPGVGRGEDGGQHPAVEIDDRSARVAAAHAAAKRGHPALHGSAPVGVGAGDEPRASDARRDDRQRAVLRDSRPRRRPYPGAALDELERRQVELGHIEDREVVVRVVVDDRRAEGGAPVGRDRGVVLAGDHMRVRHHEMRPGHPARALHAKAAGRAQHLHSGLALRRAPRGSRARRVVGRRDVRIRAAYRRRGVDPSQDVKQRARRRQRFVEAREDRRALDLLAQSARVLPAA